MDRPTLILQDGGLILVHSGQSGILPHLLLRTRCACPVCRAQPISRCAALAVRLLGFTSDPQSGVRLIFSDGHMGLYSWPDLHSLIELQDHQCLMPQLLH